MIVYGVDVWVQFLESKVIILFAIISKPAVEHIQPI
jgi:hypothetical protein